MTGGAVLIPEPRRILHVGAGGDALPAWLQGTETRLDIDPNTKPDIVASMTDMGDIGPFEAIYCCHALEHLYPHEVDVALREFWRVLSPDGIAFIFVPDLHGVSPTEDVLLDAPCGPVTGIDLIYGNRRFLKAMPHMAHHMGFVEDTLRGFMLAAGFEAVVDRLGSYNLMGVGVK